MMIAAQGFAELGMFLDAKEELEEIDPEVVTVLDAILSVAARAVAVS